MPCFWAFLEGAGMHNHHLAELIAILKGIAVSHIFSEHPYIKLLPIYAIKSGEIMIYKSERIPIGYSLPNPNHGRKTPQS